MMAVRDPGGTSNETSENANTPPKRTCAFATDNAAADFVVDVEIHGIRKTFDGHAGGHWLLADGLDLEVAPGQTVAVLGPSRSGKSTLLKMIAGLEAQDAGSIRFDGANLAAYRPSGAVLR